MSQDVMPEDSGPDRHARADEPDYAALFPVCDCREPTCERCADWQLTPRTAAVLHALAELHADDAYDDVENHGDDPITAQRDWIVFTRYPRVTWNRDGAWRRQAARAFDDLAHDLRCGRWPLPRSVAEEMALHTMVLDAPSAVEDQWDILGDSYGALPAHPDDHDWDMVVEMLFHDTDVLELFDPARDGVEDPDSDLNRRLRMGDLRPPAWFEIFSGFEPRDPGRGFRR